MATIALYAGKINTMPGLLRGAKGAVSGLNNQLGTLKRKCEKVSASVCNIDDVISSISASSKTQEEKIEALEHFGEKVEEFTKDTVETDEKVAELVNKNKDDFYEKYSYLKPDSEKSWFEKAKEGLKKAWEWCKEHWAAIVTLVVAIIAVVAIVALTIVTLGTATPVLIAAVVGAVVSLLGQVGGDLIQFMMSGEWPGSWEDYVGAAIGGAVGGILTLICGPGNPISGVVDSMLSSLIANSLKDLNGKDSNSLEELWLDATVDGITALVLGKLFEGPTKKVNEWLADKIPALSRLVGSGSFGSSYKMVLTRLKNGSFKNISSKTIINGVLDGISGDFLKNIAKGFGLEDLFKGAVKPIVRMQMIPAPVAIGEQLSHIEPLIPSEISHRMPTFHAGPFLRGLPMFRPVPIVPLMPSDIIGTIRPVSCWNLRAN